MDATVTPPQRIKGEAAAYPEMAERFHFLGKVTVEFIGGREGPAPGSQGRGIRGRRS